MKELLPLCSSVLNIHILQVQLPNNVPMGLTQSRPATYRAGNVNPIVRS